MEVDIGFDSRFDCEMRLEEFEKYMLNGPCDEDNSDLIFYGHHPPPHVDSSESWHDTLANANGGEHNRLLFAGCSPTLSRSSSHVSTGSDSSSMSFGRTNPALKGFASGQMTNLCSPLSELTRSSSSSLQSLDSDELDDSHGLSARDMVINSNKNNNQHQSHPFEQQKYMPSTGTDLRTLMDTMLDDTEVPADLCAPSDGYHEGEWGLTSRGGGNTSRDQKPELYGSSPVSPLDFPDEEGLLLRHESQSVSTPEHDELCQDVQQQLHNNSSSSIDGGRQQQEQKKFGSDPLQLLTSSSSSGNAEAAPGLHSKDFFFQHLSARVSFENCHTPSPDGFQARLAPHLGIKTDDDMNGIRLVHLLLAAAEAVASSNVDLATVILVRLKELVSRSGSTMQRVAAYFSEGLQYRIEGVKGSEKAFEPQNESLSAFQVMHEVSPYIKFGHFTANQAILEAFEGERRVHIVDYEIMEGIQWPSLMQALACRPGGPPHLRITAVCRPHVKRALAMTHETGKRLIEFAATFNIPFSFHQVRIDNEDELRPTLLKQVKGECLAVNCMLHLPHMPHRTTRAVTCFMRAMHKLSPRVFTLVEEELSCSAPTFVSHFFEALHHYSAIFDSLEATLSVESKGRQLVERIFLAPRITNLLTSSCTSDADPLRGTGDAAEGSSIHWHSLAQAVGFQSKPFSLYNLCQAKLLLGLFNDGYKVEEDNRRLLLAWRSKTLMAASVWQCS